MERRPVPTQDGPARRQACRDGDDLARVRLAIGEVCNLHILLLAPWHVHVVRDVHCAVPNVESSHGPLQLQISSSRDLSYGDR